MRDETASAETSGAETSGAETVRLTEQEAQANVHAVLQLCASGKLLDDLST